jgi:hypothetical protein
LDEDDDSSPAAKIYEVQCYETEEEDLIEQDGLLKQGLLSPS